MKNKKRVASTTRLPLNNGSAYWFSFFANCDCSNKSTMFSMLQSFFVSPSFHRGRQPMLGRSSRPSGTLLGDGAYMGILLCTAALLLTGVPSDSTLHQDSPYERVMRYVDTVQGCGDWERGVEHRRYDGGAFEPNDGLEPTYFDSPWTRRGGI